MKKFFVIGILLSVFLSFFLIKKGASLCQEDSPLLVLKKSNAIDERLFLVSSDHPTQGVHLVNKNGDVLKTWPLQDIPQWALFDKDLNLWVGFADCNPMTIATSCQFNEISRMSWAGEKENSFLISGAHHDFEPLEKDKIAVIKSSLLAPSLWPQLSEATKNCKTKGVWDDEIVEMNTLGEVLWSWSFQKNFKIQNLNEEQADCSIFHANSIRFLEHNPINKEPAYLVSARNTSSIFMVSRVSGKILWQSPRGIFQYQHDAHLSKSKKVLFFANYLKMLQDGEPISKSPYSAILEIDPKTNKVEWSYYGVLRRQQFFSDLASGVQELSDNHILVTEGVRGHLFEINKVDNSIEGSWLVKTYKKYLGMSSWPGEFIYRVQSYEAKLFEGKLDPSMQRNLKICNFIR